MGILYYYVTKSPDPTDQTIDQSQNWFDSIQKTVFDRTGGRTDQFL